MPHTRGFGNLLTRAQERDLFVSLAQARAAGSHRAVDKIETDILDRFDPLIRSNVARMARYGMDRDDLRSEALLALVRAIRKFDHRSGSRFASFAMFGVRGALLSYVRKNQSLVKAATTNKARTLFYKARGLHNDPRKIEAAAKQLGLPVEEVTRLVAAMAKPDTSLNAPVGDGEATKMDFLTDNTLGADVRYEREDTDRAMDAVIKAAMDSLDERSRSIIEHTVLAPDQSRMTLDQLGALHGVTNERIRQLRNLAVEIMEARIRRETAALGLTISDLL